ncbi:unnamed protein product [Schistocephalus solidus]|uniref:Uncharacterized protein n=1 Tax=Schistocephalus solidus TaxID=70667 RepID=A0A183TQQ8_SCHSO|nr:unnamed protein product [Schistocephalus solidus]
MSDQADSRAEDALTARACWQGLGIDDRLFFTSLSASTHSNISVEKSFGKSLVVHSHQVATPSQLHMPQHGVNAEDSGPLQDSCVRAPVLPSQLQYSAEAAEMEGFSFLAWFE